MQTTFKLPEIDRYSTKHKVESLLDQYKLYLLMEPIDLQPNITSSFSIVPPTFNNQNNSQTEDIAVKRIDQENERHKFLKWVQRCVNRLSEQERAVIIKRYLSDDDIYDYEIYKELGYSERKYYRIKSRAFYKLAFIMRVEVYKSEVRPS
ncbi:ArpU family phage packaging/lysis transcriptional regulator [Gracilibacillus sp. YIM 98692]|uniref:ArpU family phage packaging/lysis transcriptional regulator n=1 Tax=Gracilibacillus sp. YIM 98692 TaxID=2663532 RepID=UPI0013D1E46B|nr:ArpU family phage packaging/lysis transcriptional regulator [Gracilibacillus sp. YIM 98692]